MRLPSWKHLATPGRLDLLIAAGLLAWGLPDVPWWWEYPGHAGSTPDILGSLALTLLMSVPFCWRRALPVPVLGLALGVLAVRAGLQRNEISAFAAVLVAAYGLGAYHQATRRYARWLGWLSLAVAAAWVTTQNDARLDALPFALLGAAFTLGDAASARRAEAAAAVAAAHQAERARIARDLHDVVAHQLSAIAVQAGAARLAAGVPAAGTGQAAANGSPAAGGSRAAGGSSPAEVLATVERLSREALAELSHLLGALRRDSEEPAEPRPAPTLSELDALLAAGRSAGVPASLRLTGTARPLPPGVELSAYRIIQEALRNVARHAPAAPTCVTLGYEPAGLGIEVVNGQAPAGGAGTAAGAQGPGLGVQGMRERAELAGGWLTAGPRPGGGYAVTAAIPCPDRSGQVTGGAG